MEGSEDTVEEVIDTLIGWAVELGMTTNSRDHEQIMSRVLASKESLLQRIGLGNRSLAAALNANHD